MPMPVISAVPQVTTNRAASNHAQTFVVLALALVVRLLVLATVVIHYPPDWLYSRGTEMGFLAKSLLAGQGLSSPFGGATGPTALFAPIYPLLVAGVFWAFGSYSAASAIVIMTSQMFINLLTIWLMMRVAHQLFNEQTALLAGLFWACSLPLAWLPTVFWETSISICMLMGAILLSLRSVSRPSIKVWIALGLYFGMTALVNPAIFFALAAMAVWVYSQVSPEGRKHAVTGILSFLMIFSPWPIRNAHVFHAFIPLRTAVGYELWMGNRSGATGYLEESVFPTFNLHELNEYNATGEVKYCKNKSVLAMSYIVSHPGAFARLSIVRFLRFWTGTGTRGGSPIYAFHAVVTTLLGFGGIFLLFRKARTCIGLLFLSPLILFPIPYYITHAEFRFRLVLDPILTILAAYVVVDSYRLYRPKSLDGHAIQTGVDLTPALID